MTTPTK